MADNPTTSGGAAGAAPQPQVRVLAQYIKDFSFENPNIDAMLTGSGDTPRLNIEVNVAARAIPDQANHYESGIALNAKAANTSHTIYEMELMYGGLFRIENLPQQVASWPANPLLESDHIGSIPRTNVSIKISSLFARTDPIAYEGSINGLMKDLLPILEAAEHIVGDLVGDTLDDVIEQAAEIIAPAAGALDTLTQSLSGSVPASGGILTFASRAVGGGDDLFVAGRYTDYHVALQAEGNLDLPAAESNLPDPIHLASSLLATHASHADQEADCNDMVLPSAVDELALRNTIEPLI